MESIASNSPSPSPRRFRSPTQPVADRIVRALRHRLRLLHRADTNFFILGATGNVYTVTLCTSPSCTCPDRTTPCKHILFVYIRVLGVPLEDPRIKRRNLRPCQLHRLVSLPTLRESLAGESVRQMFHQLFFQEKLNQGDGGAGSSGPIEIEEGSACPVCLEEMEKGEVVTSCATCRNLIHEECLIRWKKSRGRRAASCVICRARWKDSRVDDRKEKYINLAAFVGEEDGMMMMVQDHGSDCAG
ncbi:hypothetical protein ACFE04_011491 [Oxalis oulophora]